MSLSWTLNRRGFSDIRGRRRAIASTTRWSTVEQARAHWLATHLTLTIDTNNDSIEGLEMEIQVFSLPVLQVFAEITQVNPRVSQAPFDYRTHVAPGTKVVLRDSEEKK